MSSSGRRIVVNKHTPMAVESFSRLGTVVPLETTAVTREAIRDADILVVRSETKVDKDLLEGSSVRFVGTVTIGTDHIDVDHLKERGIAFASAPGSNANSVAEYVAAALLTWSARANVSLPGKTIGIVGVGNVGKKVVQVARALGMVPLLNDPPLAHTTGDPAFLSLDDLMAADVVTLHVPLEKTGPDATMHLFDDRRIRAMKRGALLVNTSRGGVVETKAVSAALANGHLGSAILDVWENEPSIDVQLLGQAIIGTPHIAGYSLDGKLNALRMVYEKVCDFVGEPVSPVAQPIGSSDKGLRLVPPATLKDRFAVARWAVHHMYEIERDDRNLRSSMNHAGKDRGKEFMKLRAEYPVRREFFHATVELSASQSSARDVLEGLGFSIVVREAST